ncbi:MAG: hypothetical protein ACM3X0_06150 [Bacteroidota bacterium]
MLWEPIVYLVLPVVTLAGLLICVFDIWDNLRISLREASKKSSSARP